MRSSSISQRINQLIGMRLRRGQHRRVAPLDRRLEHRELRREATRQRDPREREEEELAARRTLMMQAEKVAEDLREAHEVIAGASSSVPALSGVIRRLERRAAQAPAATARAASVRSRRARTGCRS